MSKTRDDLFARFEELGLNTTTVDHKPVFTVAESKAECGHIPGGHCKNLFLKDRKGGLWLVVTLEDRAINMKALEDKIGSHRLSFGRAELLTEILGVEPGSVTPFSLINDSENRVNVVLDAEMMACGTLNYHPLQNNATTSITPDDLLTFIESCGHKPAVVRL